MLLLVLNKQKKMESKVEIYDMCILSFIIPGAFKIKFCILNKNNVPWIFDGLSMVSLRGEATVNISRQTGFSGHILSSSKKSEWLGITKNI